VDELFEIFRFGGGGIGVFGVFADLGEFAVVQPDAAAVGAGIDLDLAVAGVAVAHEDDAGTAGAVAAGLEIDLDGEVVPDVEVRLEVQLGGFVDALEFAIVEPDAAATFGANIDDEVSDFDWSKFATARGAFHSRQVVSQPRGRCGGLIELSES